MNLPDAPTAHEGFFAAHFFTVSDQDKSKDFYVRILGGKVIKPDHPCYIKLAKFVDHSQFRRWPDSRQA
jgi:catechol 2,3-dioxygenase-like lactoylglutathione lyase family enzyme